MPHKILVVDSAESTRHFTRYVLTNVGFRVTSVTNARDALELVSEESFAAIITDVLNEEFEGIEMVQKIRSVDGFETLPILMITLCNLESAKQQAEAAGVTAWFTKPVPAKKLVEIIKDVCADMDDDEDIPMLY
ncbi:MAG: response regulator [Gammaproteobacteria bacterium]|nr:response regulator [Gammaproteobacteria bacterium]MDH5650426.1 response regulator [Gammaproteobacteria bacterium]